MTNVVYYLKVETNTHELEQFPQKHVCPNCGYCPYCGIPYGLNPWVKPYPYVTSEVGSSNGDTIIYG